MRKLIDFLYSKREIGVFLFLVFISTWLLVGFNQRPGSAFFNSSNMVAASISQKTNDFSDYFELKEINNRIIKENKFLKTELQKLKTSPDSYVDTLGRFQVIGAKVISNTFTRSKNFLTLAAGRKDSVEVGMGVVSSSGIVGQVKSVSGRFATVYSVLHPNLMISSKIKRTKTKGTVQWNQSSFLHADLKYIPRHIDLQVGDTVVTSGFNSVFPENLTIGVVDQVNLEDQMTFYNAQIKLSTDFSSLDYVYLIKDLLRFEIDSIQQL